MKKIRVLCVGKIKEDYLKDGIAEYAKRLSRFCGFTILELPDCGSGEAAVKKESALILEKLDGGFNILLDKGGKACSSEEIAGIIDAKFSAGESGITFIIGGSEGVSDAVKQAAGLVLSFGNVTYPHRLMRLILAEQVYRALTISEGLPYHK